VVEHVVPVQRLLDVVQPEFVDLTQQVDHLQGVGRVRVDGEFDVGELVAHRRQQLDVPARLDLQLHPFVALLHVSRNALDCLRDRVHAQARPYRNLCALATEQGAQRNVLLAGIAIPDGQLQCRLRHRVTAPLDPASDDLCGMLDGTRQQLGRKGVA